MTVLRHHGKVHCLDSLCYHMGERRLASWSIRDSFAARQDCLSVSRAKTVLSTASFLPQGGLLVTRAILRTCPLRMARA